MKRRHISTRLQDLTVKIIVLQNGLRLGGDRDREAKKHKDCVVLDQYRSALIPHPLPPAILVKRPLQQINAHYVLSRSGIA